jgi:hypothetical protein
MYVWDQGNRLVWVSGEVAAVEVGWSSVEMVRLPIASRPNSAWKLQLQVGSVRTAQARNDAGEAKNWRNKRTGQ